MRVFVFFSIVAFLWNLNHVYCQSMFIPTENVSGIYSIEISDSDTLLTIIDTVRYRTHFELDDKKNPITENYYYTLFVKEKQIGKLEIGRSEKAIILKFYDSPHSTAVVRYYSLDQFEETSSEFSIYKDQSIEGNPEQHRILYYRTADMYMPMEISVNYKGKNRVLHLKMNEQY